MLHRLAVRALHDAHLVALIDELAHFPLRTRERGRRYAAEGRVDNVASRDGSISATVHGAEPYSTSWEWTRAGGWQSLCTCPVGDFCKHAYALGCVILSDARGELHFTDARLRSLLPEAIAHARHVASRPRRAAGQDALQRLRSGRAEWERQSALDRLLTGAPVFGLSPYAPPLLDLLREADPDVRCWRLAEAIAQLADGWVPPALQPYRDRPDLATRFVARERDALAAELLGWASARSSVARRRLRVVFTLQQRGDGAPALVFEVRVTTPRLADAPRTPGQLQGLRTATLRDPGLFPPAQTAVLDWLADHAVVAGGATAGGTQPLTTDMPLALLERVANSPLSIWADDIDPDLAARGGIAPGGPVRLDGDDARLVPEYVRRDGGASIELRFRWPDGRQRALNDAIYVGGGAPLAGRRASLVLADGAFSAVADEPPPELLERFRTVGSARWRCASSTCAAC
jgi:hypothetical protein